MKKILLGLVAVFALTTIAPVFAQEGGGDAPKTEKKGGKKKKGKKGDEGGEGGGDADKK